MNNRIVVLIIFYLSTLLILPTSAIPVDTSSYKPVPHTKDVINSINIRLDSLSSQIDKNEILRTSADSTFRNNIYRIEGEISALVITVEKDIEETNAEIKRLNFEIIEEVDKLNKNIQEYHNQVNELQRNISAITDSISATSNALNSSRSETNKRISNIDDKISKRTLYWIITILVIILFTVLVFFILKKEVIVRSDSLSEEIANTREKQAKLESEAIQLDTKLVQVLEQKLDTVNLHTTQSAEPDHTLPLKLGEEIHRMRSRLNTMEVSQGVKVLKNRLEILEEKLNGMGYEIVNLEGKPFNEGMTVQARFIPDESLNEGEEIITRVIKPQISYNDVLIQAAEVEVSKGINSIRREEQNVKNKN